MKRILAGLFIFNCLVMTAHAADSINIIPQPVKLVPVAGRFVLPSQVTVVLNSKVQELNDAASRFATQLQTASGCQVKIESDGKTRPGAIHLVLNKTNDSELGDEGYTLKVSSEGAFVHANRPAGLYYGIQTLLQLLPKEIESASLAPLEVWSMPNVEITDYPRFEWRGMMLDVARHFFTKEEVKGFIDNMVKFKYNRLHWHLSDDQGWRIEIKSLPKLTEVGAWRAPRTGVWNEFTKPAPDEPKTYGGFYTQEDIKEVIEYAKARFVTILPEIDVPGHSLAAVASYPELSCTPGTYQVNAGERFMVWEKGTFYGLIDNTLCPANDYTYEFLDKVFTEIAALFPFEYIHIGGDEAYKGYWEKSEACQKLMKREGLKNVEELQSYFVKRVQKIVNAKGKKIIGWDEILEGGLAPGATVMSWRGMAGGIAAAKMKHHVVMSPSDYAYFDLMQGDKVAETFVYSTVLLNKSYQFDPVPAGIDPDYILGGQCNLWTEKITNTRHMNYMLWPRGLATAESVWSPKSQKDWTSFYKRVEKQFERFDVAETKYSRSMYDPIFTSTIKDSTLLIHMDTQIEGLDIYYSFDETAPDRFYPKYTEPLSIPKDASNLKVVTYRGTEQVGKQITMPVKEMRGRAKKI